MPQITYVMKFTGTAAPSASDPNVVHVRTTGLSNVFTTHVTDRGVTGSLTADPEGAAFFESEVTMRGQNSFLENGTITFGDEGDHRLRFTTVGEGVVGANTEAGQMQGCVLWRVEGGDGQFAGASGYVTSNFTMSQNGEVADYQVGVIWVP